MAITGRITGAEGTTTPGSDSIASTHAEGYRPPTRAHSEPDERQADGGGLRAVFRLGDTVNYYEGEQSPR